MAASGPVPTDEEIAEALSTLRVLVSDTAVSAHVGSRYWVQQAHPVEGEGGSEAAGLKQLVPHFSVSRSMKACLQKHGYSLQDNSGDGQCLFLAHGDCTRGPHARQAEAALNLRAEVCAFVERNEHSTYHTMQYMFDTVSCPCATPRVWCPCLLSVL